MLTRRSLLTRTAALAAASSLVPRRARASVAPEDLKFVFVMVFRGWDVTRVFAPEFDNPAVDMEADAEEAVIGGIRFVDHPRRASVRSFFESWHQRALVLDGIVVPSLGHVECLNLMLRGSNIVTDADWPARIAGAAANRYALPHVVVNGPNFPGTLGGFVTRVGSTAGVEQVLDGSVLAADDAAIRRFSAGGSAAMDAAVANFSASRRGRAVTARERVLTEAHEGSLARLATLKARAGDLTWPGDTRLTSQTPLAVDLLRQDLTRCVTLAHDYVEWDSHAENDMLQSAMFEDLFAGLDDLMVRLSDAPGTHADTLAHETVVVVLSEMGRTPNLNGGAGKDHWPHTSALLVGPNLASDRVVGGFDALFTSRPIDFATGDLTDTGTQIGTKNLGATLLALAGIDPAEQIDADPIDGVLA
ncbi:MAG: DUF1501 domain-containing protein [Myxococcota bacterium]